MLIEYLEKLIDEEEWDRAVALGERLITKSDITSSDLLYIHSSILTAKMYIGDYSGACTSGKVAIELALVQNQWDVYGNVCVNLGVVYDRLGQLQEALECWLSYLTYLPYYKTARKHEANVWYNIGIAYRSLGNGPQASASFTKALQAADQHGDTLRAHGIRQALISSYVKVGAVEFLPRLFAKTGHFLRRHSHKEELFGSHLWQLQLRTEYLLYRERLSRARCIAVRGLYASEGMPRYQFYFHMLLAKIALRESCVAEAYGHALAAKAYAALCKRHELEAQASELVYRVAKDSPQVTSRWDVHYTSVA